MENELKKQVKEKRKERKLVIAIVIAIIVFIVLGIICIVYVRNNDNSVLRKKQEPQELKPIIYLYPEQEEKVQVKLGNPQYISCIYPKYEGSWNVIAKPDGTLIDEKTGKNYYALYWEGEGIPKNTDKREGFCIKGEDTVDFLEEKLKILGLNDRETEEFIIYWLPKMQNNAYNYIRFETVEEQNKAMPLEITPKPDSIIRIMMDWKGLESPIQVKEQVLKTPERKGFVAIEWGGSEL